MQNRSDDPVDSIDVNSSNDVQSLTPQKRRRYDLNFVNAIFS